MNFSFFFLNPRPSLTIYLYPKVNKQDYPSTREAMKDVVFLAAGPVAAAEFTVSVKNLTNRIYFTPLLITAHDKETHLFETGFPASPALQAMAEGGDLTGLVELLGGVNQDTVDNPAGGLLALGEMVSEVYFNTHRTHHRYLSLVAMLLPINDGFVDFDALPIPRIPGSYHYYLVGYDAGTEANDELLMEDGGGVPGTPGIPAAPGGDAGSGGTGAAGPDSNIMVHIHRISLGDTNPEGGISDLDSTIHRWLNPLAEVTIEVLPNRHQSGR